jgi:beta-ureidopropionase / N-carbamoyl-L-amino-acid hydrolase
MEEEGRLAGARTNQLSANGERFWETIAASSKIGPGVAGGLRRLALSDSDKEVRDLFWRWCEEAGCAVSVDRMGSMFARRAGREDLPPVLVGSHLDSQIAGGRFDGIVGVLAGLEIVRTLNDLGIETRRPIEVVNWTNEEGARFQPPMVAAGVFAGVYRLDWALARPTRDPKPGEGKTLGEELDRIGFAGETPVGGREIDSYFELHIEQGPELDRTGVQVGIVTGGYAVRALLIRVKGETAHTGPTPMEKRRNALVGAARMIAAADDLGWDYAGSDGKVTAARLTVSPNLAGILSDLAELSLDLRHPDPVIADKMLAELETRIARAARRAQVEYEIVERFTFGDQCFDSDCIRRLRDAADALGVSRQDMLSQAGHDAYHIATRFPTAMLFSPCIGGITHNEGEDTTLKQQLPALNTLLNAVVSRADR